jgi:regulator of ribonuclease activity B
MSMDWFVLLVCAAGAVAAWRIYVSIRKLREARDDGWDARAIERLRKAGSDPFKPHEVDFFFGLPTEAACANVQTALEADGFKVDLKPVKDGSTHPFSLHATKSIRLSAPDMKELSRRLTDLASAQGGRYDGWTAGHVARDEEQQ